MTFVLFSFPIHCACQILFIPFYSFVCLLRIHFMFTHSLSFSLCTHKKKSRHQRNDRFSLNLKKSINRLVPLIHNIRLKWRRFVQESSLFSTLFSLFSSNLFFTLLLKSFWTARLKRVKLQFTPENSVLRKNASSVRGKIVNDETFWS